jgi:hypothetical protein
MDHHPQTKQNIKQYHEKACNHHEPSFNYSLSSYFSIRTRYPELFRERMETIFDQTWN